MEIKFVLVIHERLVVEQLTSGSYVKAELQVEIIKRMFKEVFEVDRRNLCQALRSYNRSRPLYLSWMSRCLQDPMTLRLCTRMIVNLEPTVWSRSKLQRKCYGPSYKRCYARDRFTSADSDKESEDEQPASKRIKTIHYMRKTDAQASQFRREDPFGNRPDTLEFK